MKLSASDLGPGTKVLSVDGADAWLDGAHTDQPAGKTQLSLAPAEEPALLMYTSGTTGTSKGAVLSHNNVLATVTGLLSAWAWEQDDVLLLPLPLFHTHGLVVGLHCALAMGATIRLRTGFDETETVDILAGRGATLFFAVPTIYTRLVDMLGQLERTPDFSAVRLFCSGSAPLPAEVHNEFERLSGKRILERYGMTETGHEFQQPVCGAAHRRNGGDAAAGRLFPYRRRGGAGRARGRGRRAAAAREQCL